MRRVSVLAGVCLAALVASACGSAAAPRVASIGTTTTPPKAAATVASGPAPEAVGKLGGDAEKFAACMRSHGVANFPDPVIGPGQVSIHLTPSVASSPHFNSAQAACQHLLPGKPTSSQLTTQQQADYLKAAACMRSHNIVGFPDPVFPSPGNVQFRLPAGMDANSPRFEAARAICEKLIPQGLPYSN
ncbi:MAG TPA: hypothetical protein VN786_14155 [Acidimicrobiales bacterium]|nr:hypothetical protein [Acidimicrobiales bacterium]